MDEIRKARKQKGWTQARLATEIGVKSSVISKYESGQIEPSISTLKSIAAALNIPFAKLIPDDRADEKISLSVAEQSLIKKYRLLDPCWKEIVDGILDIEYRRRLKDLKRRKEDYSTETSDEISGDIVYFMVPEYSLPMSAGTGQMAENEWAEDLQLIKAPPRGTSYVAHVKGDSMEPTYHDGDLLFVHSTQEIQPGDIGVFLLEGDHYVKELGKGVLISHNSEYDPIPITEGIQCQGLVLGVCDESYFE